MNTPDAHPYRDRLIGAPITSTQNALVKRTASLRQRKFREREGAFLVEGADLVAAGMACGLRPQAVFVAAARASELVAALGLAEHSGAPTVATPAVFPVPEHVAARLSTLETPPDVMAVFPLPERRPLGSLRERAGRHSGHLLLVYADALADPGNMGTLLRAAVAFGATALVVAPGSVDLYGPKTVRGSMGAVFGLPLFADLPLAAVVAEFPAARVYGLAAHGGEPLPAAGLRRPAVLVVGAERSGLSPAAQALVSQVITIPLAPGVPGVVESLNVGVAGAIALYEFSRSGAAAPAPTGSPDGPGH